MMAGATLSSSLPARFSVKVENPRSTPLEVEMKICQEKTNHSVNDRDALACPYCSFTSESLSEMKSHRWEVHPLLAKRKGHLMSTSPNNVRKRPNSESSEVGKYLNPEDCAPVKKSSPLHRPLSSGELSPDWTETNSRSKRSSSTDEIMSMDCANVVSVSDKDSGISNYVSLKPVEASKLWPSDVHDQNPSQYSNYKQYDCFTRSSASESPDSDSGCVPSPPSPVTYPETCDLHTLAKAAFNASPIRQPSTIAFENKPFVVSPSISYHPPPLAYVIGENFRSPYSLQDPSLNNFQLHGLHPNNRRTSSPGNSLFCSTTPAREACFSNQVTEPFVNSLLPVVPSSIPPQVSNAFIPATNVPIATYISNPVSVPHNISTPESTSDQTKLSALSQVASNCLSPSKHVKNEKNKFLTGSLLPSQSSGHQNNSDNKLLTFSVQSNKKNFSCTENLLKSAQHCHSDKKIIMDDDRLRSLEEALSKIDCCDPQERSNVLPYRCPDGKWRMVQTRCVGGAWLILLPGAQRPSVYVPIQKASASNGTLDNWLKARLTSSDRSVSPKNSNNHPNKGAVLKKPSHGNGKRVVSPVNPKRCHNFLHLGTNQPVQSGAIKSLLLQKSSLS